MGEPPTALVVEDDLMQRALVSILLEESDMRVIQCASAEAALVMLDRIGPRLAMMFTDVELAGDIDGIELAYQARTRFPDLRIVVTSGAPRVRRLPDGTTFMVKPWMPLDVLREAQHALMH
jgi:DNA-binding NtrC family response regulator